MADSRSPELDVDRLIADRRTRIIVCCGSGGVGKTTIAAAIGLRAAERGRHVVVLTVDPARRLAQSMGLTSLDNTPRLVPGVRPDAGRVGWQPPRHDARHEADLRRDCRAAR
jgi:Mrp family chromosome partitioning ATPase